MTLRFNNTLKEEKYSLFEALHLVNTYANLLKEKDFDTND